MARNTKKTISFLLAVFSYLLCSNAIPCAPYTHRVRGGGRSGRHGLNRLGANLWLMGCPRPAARRPKPVRPPMDRLREKTGAGGGGRTLMTLRSRDFESRASASSATPAQIADTVHFTYTHGSGEIQARARDLSRIFPAGDKDGIPGGPLPFPPMTFSDTVGA
jgi:hypothetical protein